MKVTDMQLAQVFNTLYAYIREHGQYLKPNHPQFGGMWSADVYELGGVKALLSDAGYGASIVKPGELNCYMQYGSLESEVNVNFTVGGPTELRKIANEVTKLTAMMAEDYEIPEAVMNAILHLEKAAIADSGDNERGAADRSAARRKLVNAIKQHIK